MPQASLKAYKPEVVQYVRENLEAACIDPERTAAILKTEGYYSNTTYLPDITGSVRKIVKLLADNKT